MTPNREHHYTENVQEHLHQVQNLLDKHTLVEMLARKQEMPRQERHELLDSILHKQHLAELQNKLSNLHSSDIAFILEALPIEQRLLVWDLVKADRDGEILIEVSDAVRESLIATMSREELREAAEQLDTDEIADLAHDLPHAVMRDVFKSLTIEEREQLRAAMSYPEDAVGALMDFDMVTIREDVTLEVVSRYLRRFDDMPDHTDQLFVVDRNDIFKGVLPLNRLLVNEPEVLVSKLMLTDTIKLHSDDKAEQAAQAFERYDLVSAPVLEEDGKLVGRVTVNTAMDYIRSESESDILNTAGLREEEDIFASVWKSVKNRWMWLALNLCTAFFASRVIGEFENTIEKLVALAALMPIVAGIAGNSANQTATIIIRSLALGQLNQANTRRLISKELTIGGLNGLIWGGIAGLFAYVLYKSVLLGVILTGAMVLNLVLGALAGLLIPLSMQRMGRDPAIGSSVLLTAITDSGGFFIFLGLAALFLIH
ncbi:Magnesium transporter MgtE [Candidatus Nitrotoga sp. BS]|uniref:magnesium transporter n=1 Tax=Candidatus Nitrotoga sp. BS TaxID=2890408 RepID=UPI001EF1B4E9|nr:magnesium transporter [Candidatus Nitrotoga sp. BS]CAH1198339.1 Magnesium transporter MgtE [Candidatus Nitrotoga sp. BS]